MRYLCGLFLVVLVITSVQGQDGFKTPNLPGDLMIDIGLNYWDATSDSLEQKGWRSKSIGFYYTRTKLLGNKFAFRYGAGVGLEKISLGIQHTLLSQGDTVIVDDLLPELNGGLINKNKLAITYFDLMVEQRFYPKGTEEGEGFFIGVGGILGLRLNAHTKWKYETVDEPITEKTSGRFDLNSIRYGIHTRIGFKGVHLFFKQYFSNTFRDDVIVNDQGNQDFNPTMRTFGINITGF